MSALSLRVVPRGYDELNELLTVKEVANYLRCTRGKVYSDVRAGRLRSKRIGKLIWIPRSELRVE
jgi:excisionase family DNA binding protein